MAPQHLAAPEGWIVSTVGRECSIDNQLRLPLSENERKEMQGIYPYYGPTKAVDFLDHYRVEGRYALIGEDGDHFLKYASQDMTLLVDGQFNVNNHAHLVRGNGRCTTEWFFTFFRRQGLTPYLTRQGAGRYKLNKATLESLPILIPPLQEQIEIFRIISGWDSAIDLTEQLIAEKWLRRKGLMQQLLTGKLRLPGFTGKWRRARLGDIFHNRTESGRTDLPLVSIAADRGVIPRDEIDRKDSSSEDKSKYLRICPGDIGYNTMRMWQGVSGLSSVEGIVSPAYTIVTPKAGIDGGFMAIMFKFQPIVHLFYRHSQGLVSDTWNLKFRHFARIKVTIPDEGEQIAIAKVFHSLDRELELLQTKAKALREQRKGLMQQLLTGKKRLKM